MEQSNHDEIGGYELAERVTGFKRATLYGLVHEKRIPHFRLSPRSVRFRRSTLESWIEAGFVAPTPATMYGGKAAR